MTLIPVPTATVAVAAAQTQIAIWSNTTGEALYTVPAGRKFAGHFWGSGTATGNVQLNGQQISFSGYTNNLTPVYLVEGTVLTKPDTTQIWIIGVEEDA
jgi:hypothetical protein